MTPVAIKSFINCRYSLMATYLPDVMMSEEEMEVAGGGGGGGEVLEEIFLDTPMEGAPLTAGNSSFINDVIKDLDFVSCIAF